MNDPRLENSIRLIRNLMEDAPVNSVGGGHIAGLGVGDQGEPPGIPASKKKRKKKRYIYQKGLRKWWNTLIEK
jgi:hypothetical protein